MANKSAYHGEIDRKLLPCSEEKTSRYNKWSVVHRFNRSDPEILSLAGRGRGKMWTPELVR
jgi:hypothetical protein